MKGAAIPSAAGVAALPADLDPSFEFVPSSAEISMGNFARCGSFGLMIHDEDEAMPLLFYLPFIIFTAFIPEPRPLEREKRPSS